MNISVKLERMDLKRKRDSMIGRIQFKIGSTCWNEIAITLHREFQKKLN